MLMQDQTFIVCIIAIEKDALGWQIHHDYVELEPWQIGTLYLGAIIRSYKVFHNGKNAWCADSSILNTDDFEDIVKNGEQLLENSSLEELEKNKIIGAWFRSAVDAYLWAIQNENKIQQKLNLLSRPLIENITP
jgi:hypothetical protein